jgi:hypothetical protein
MAEYFQLLELKGLPVNVVQTVGRHAIRPRQRPTRVSGWKVRSYLLKKGIDYVEICPSHPHYHIDFGHEVADDVESREEQPLSRSTGPI